jgi:hypothetical protein
MGKPVVYIASPYSGGDPERNTHFQCLIFNTMMNDGKAWPIAPLWSHFQHMMFPRAYADWITYDQALLPLYDACVRLTAKLDNPPYEQHASSGADGEVATFQRLGKPVFYSLADLYHWIDTEWKG